MKIFIFLTLAIALASSTIYGQKRKPLPGKTKRTVQNAARGKENAAPVNPAAANSADEANAPSQTSKGKLSEADGEWLQSLAAQLKKEKPKPSARIFEEMEIDKWGAASIILPEDLTEIKDDLKTSDKEEIQWMEFTRSWRQPVWGIPSALEAEFSLKMWNAGMKDLADQLPQGMQTPADLVRYDLRTTLAEKKKPGSMFKEAKMMTIDGYDGSFARLDVPDNPGRFVITWFSYRYYKDKLQNIFLTIEGEKSELVKALASMKTLKFKAGK